MGVQIRLEPDNIAADEVLVLGKSPAISYDLIVPSYMSIFESSFRWFDRLK